VHLTRHDDEEYVKRKPRSQDDGEKERKPQILFLDEGGFIK
jgi:hypothetical protein